MSAKLNSGNRHLLFLIGRDADEHGWTKVSKVVSPLVEALPSELVEMRYEIVGISARLTEAGKVVLKYT